MRRIMTLPSSTIKRRKFRFFLLWWWASVAAVVTTWGLSMLRLITRTSVFFPLLLCSLGKKTDRYLMSLFFLSSSVDYFLFHQKKRKRIYLRLRYDQFNHSLFSMESHSSSSFNDKHILMKDKRWFYIWSFSSTR